LKEEKMSNKPKEATTGRRDFLKLAGLGTVVGGAALVSGRKVEAAEPVSGEGSGYRETEHVRTFYSSTRF
jgi:hypothetical protein